MDVLMGIDIGTSSCKLAVFDENGEVVATETEKYPVFHKGDGRVEQDPEDWWTHVCAATRRIMASDRMRAANLRGIGIDGQGWSMIPIDRTGSVVYPNPIWMDTRATDVCAEAKGRIGEELIFEVCGNPMEPTYTLPKILWLKKHEPDVYARIDKVLQANSFIVYKLTGEITQDISQGYGLQCFDIRKGTWDEGLCAEFGISPDILPPICNSDVVVGGVSAIAAEESGLPVGTPVVAGGMDAACGTLGSGVISPGETQEQGGQAEGMSICLDSYVADPRLIMGYHVVPGLWLLQGGTVGGGGVIDWAKDNLCFEEKITSGLQGTNAYHEMNLAVDSIPAGSDGVVFLPYMRGERSPIWNPHAKGVYFGLSFDRTKAHMLRAAYEGIAFSLKHNLDIAEAAGAEVDSLWAMGGSANSNTITQIKADVTGKKIFVAASDTATTLGAALLAGVGVGMYASYQEAKEKAVRVRATYTPDPEKAAAYDRAYKTYLDLYEHLEDMMVKDGLG